MPTAQPNKGDRVLFEDTTAAPKEVVVLIYDFEDFTSFLSIPDIHRDVARYLTFVHQQMQMIFSGGDPIWTHPDLKDKKESVKPLPVNILQEKFLGDGAMFVSQLAESDPKERDNTLEILCNRGFNAKHYFPDINQAAMKFMPVSDLPKRVRIGITYGTVLELNRTDGKQEYVGYAINLAARLQKYAGNASFLASARLPRSEVWLTENDYIKVRATALRARTTELVFIDKHDFEASQKRPQEKGLFERI
jgi:hypothetical protein